jgi:hypothetical protein
VLGVALGLFVGGGYLLFQAKWAPKPRGPRPKGGFPNVGPYTRAGLETGYQRRRLAVVGIVCWVVAVLCILGSIYTSG